eukprot:scaffold609661_cov24-Prasinocladus_malaysianus.AAC.1
MLPALDTRLALPRQLTRGAAGMEARAEYIVLFCIQICLISTLLAKANIDGSNCPPSGSNLINLKTE